MGFFLCVGVLALGADAPAAAVWTPSGRHEGPVEWQADALTVGGKRVAWGEVQYLALAPSGESPREPHRLHLLGGEVWAGAVEKLEGGRVHLRSRLLGPRSVSLDRVARLVFLPDSPRLGDEPGTLYRSRGEPIPGMPLGLDGEKLTLKSPLGEIAVPRRRVVGYVFPPPEGGVPGPERADEVALADGSVLHGRLTVTDEGFSLHALLGEIALPRREVLSVVRHGDTFMDLTDALARSARTTPLVASDSPAGLRVLRGAGLCARGLHVEPPTVLRGAVPEREGKVFFRATLHRPEGARGRARVRIGGGEWREAAGEEVVEEVSPGKELVIEVDFAGPVRFPSGAVLGDPHLSFESPD